MQREDVSSKCPRCQQTEGYGCTCEDWQLVEFWMDRADGCAEAERDALRADGGAEAGLREAVVNDDSLSRQIGELGNQIHNLGCEHQNDEKLSERLQELRSMAWDLARRAALARPSAPETLAWAVVGEDGKPRQRWIFRDKDYAEIIKQPGERVHPVAIRVMEDGA